jgi:predicted RNA binding protein YcfA (HicA-like mRNA interferase family)
MKLPRDISGEELARILRKYDYQITRQTGSHIRLTTAFTGKEHHITIPKHNPLKIGTLSNIINEVTHYLDIDRNTLIIELFG